MNRYRIGVGIDWRHFQLLRSRLRGEKTKGRSTSEISASNGALDSEIDSYADSASSGALLKKNTAFDRDERSQ